MIHSAVYEHTNQRAIVCLRREYLALRDGKERKNEDNYIRKNFTLVLLTY
jgi:hypothetical protein